MSNIKTAAYMYVTAETALIPYQFRGKQSYVLTVKTTELAFIQVLRFAFLLLLIDHNSINTTTMVKFILVKFCNQTCNVIKKSVLSRRFYRIFLNDKNYCLQECRTNVYDGGFLWTQLNAVNYFCDKAPSQVLKWVRFSMPGTTVYRCSTEKLF